MLISENVAFSCGRDMMLLVQNEKAYVWIAFINISNSHYPCSYSWCSILFVANIMLFHTQHDNFDIHKLNVEDTDVYISIGTTFLRVFIKNNLYRFSSENLAAWNPRPPLCWQLAAQGITCKEQRVLSGSPPSSPFSPLNKMSCWLKDCTQRCVQYFLKSRD